MENIKKVSPNFTSLISLFKKEKRVTCNPIPESSDSFFISQLFKKRKELPLLVVTQDLKEAERVTAELNSQFESDDIARLFPAANAVPYNMRSSFGPTREARLQLLNSLLNGDKFIVVTPSSSLYEQTIAPQNLFAQTIRISVNDEVIQATLAEWMVAAGFKRESSVSEPGDFAVRGGIVDIYPFGYDNPIRVEFWGDTIDSIREFDIFKQKSLKAIRSVEVIPMKEFLPTTESREKAINRVEKFVKEKRISPKLYDMILHSWGSLSEIDGLEWFSHWFDFNKQSATLLDYLPENCSVVWQDYLTCNERYERELENYHNHKKRVPEMQAPFVTEPENLLADFAYISKKISKLDTVFLKSGDKNLPSQRFDFINQPSFGGDLTLFINDVEKKLENGFSVSVSCETTGHLKRLLEQIEPRLTSLPELSVNYLKSGFFSMKQRVALYSEAQIFDRTAQRKFSSRTKRSAPIISFDALNRGDYVVHVDHGVGHYLGIEEINVGDYSQDCMVIEYKDGAKIRVPITDFHKVQKYIGKDSHKPALSKLGSSAWEKKKERTRRALQEMASELIKLYAKREFNKGIEIGADTKFQEEFEEAFLYEPTPDQSESCEKIKQDMESERPMDRLVCGDVGFGKTEVAMRAAFKAVMSGYQVAILAPTTVLAAQHGLSFRERMGEFPVNISVLSRLTAGDSGRRIKERVLNGDVDILIGTHKILSKAIKYKNLGLVVIDEEQRFGVKQKERFTELRHSVNVLSMSATPIPRTLHMSMAGVRDLSLIATPPRNRLPIETTVTESHDDIFQSAILNEIERGGQVFVVLNRISGLDELYHRIEKLVPQAKVGVAHGQMEGDLVNDIMQSFTAGEYDVLLSTTIIENGIDISNANTIIVERSDMLGLSQLYQLRGRVGRSGEQAFAYFFVDSFKKVKEESIKRLKALEQYTDLGSGFQLAMRDLELRGAGNLLGTDQSGSIAAVGFELYCQLLKEEIDRLRDGNKTDSATPDPKLRLGISGHFPASYISDSNMRIMLYQRCTSLKTFEELREFEREVADRFGAHPEEVGELILLMEIKVYAKRFKLREILVKNDKLTLILAGSDGDIRETCSLFMGLKNGNFSLKYGEEVKLVTGVKKGEVLAQARIIKNILKRVLFSK
jgi:transcription-repair coupling factor (superfamily II helicase)